MPPLPDFFGLINPNKSLYLALMAELIKHSGGIF